MRASEAFPDTEERRSVRRIMLSVEGMITKIHEPDGAVIYENNSYEQRKNNEKFINPNHRRATR
jgi:hypothetical protein